MPDTRDIGRDVDAAAMTPERWHLITEAFHAALARDPATRGAFLDNACAGDSALRAEIDALLAAHQEAGNLGERPVFSPPTAVHPGTTLGSYRIDALIGAGGMCQVYRARHLKLGREAAIKVLPGELATDPERLRRFEREARTASALNHPSIVTIYDIDEHDGIRYIAMELIAGETLRERVRGGPLPIKDALRVAVAIADGLARAHDAGIVHRDVKPENVMITGDGQVKILDFGIAKQSLATVATAPMSAVSQTTRQGTVLGTAPYMSPEQAAGEPVDPLSDQFSFGVVLYEMLCGRRPFQGDTVATVLGAILRDEPPAPRSVRPDLSRDLEAVILRTLEKDPTKRYATARELGEALRRCESVLAPRSFTLNRRTVFAALAVVAVIGGSTGWIWFRDDFVRRRERGTLAEIVQLTEAGELDRAFALARAVEQELPDDPEVRTMLHRITLPVSIVTNPPGATVRVKAYSSPDAPWMPLGTTPLKGVRLPYALMRWRISKEGYETFEGAPFGSRSLKAFAEGFSLDPVGSRPGMVRVPGGAYKPPYMRFRFQPVKLTDFWLDRYEVTNRKYKDFVDAGGYTKREQWKEPFVDGGQAITWEAAMRRLTDATGRPGPASWEFGGFPAGKADFPVSGVSWYEAAAYCRSVGKRLPTLYHWAAATGQDQLSDILRLSNFGREGPALVGSHAGLGDFGTYDMAGNVKEWSWNAAATGRYILGGAWGEPTYTFRVNADAQPPLSREAAHGFRCASFDGPIDDALHAPIMPSKVPAAREPVGEDIFAAYRRMYEYDRTDLDPTVIEVDDSSPHWRTETVSFEAAYGGERVIAHLFLPRNASPPFQPVIWYPGNDAFFLRDSEGLASMYLFDFIPRSGRALVYPVYKGMYERRVPFSFAPNEWRDMIVLWSKDIGRTIDYLEGRSDMNTRRLGYYGFSSGAVYGPIFTAVDDRFKASVLLAGGLFGTFLPEVDAANFAPRSRVPTLMINGENDFITPSEMSEPLFRMLGAPADRKRHARLPGGHIPPDRLAIIGEVVAWFDRHLGPVETSGLPGRTSSR